MKKRGTVKLPIHQLQPHPQNPRKDLGDLTELAESIKKNGILQNLSVVPIEAQEPYMHYKVLIGHRRCAAAKLAGLDEVPCTILTDVSEQEQFTIMLEENMQRNDLTISEQAFGFQYMLDLGMTKDDISEKTGFSKSTINKRLELAKLDRKTLEKKLDQNSDWQISLTDLARLEQVDDIKRRNEILEQSTGHQDFIWKIQYYLREKKVAANTETLKAIMKREGIPKHKNASVNDQWSGQWDKVREWSLSDDIDTEKISIQLFDLKKKDNLVWSVWNRSFVLIRPKKKEKHEETKYEKEQRELKSRIRQLNEIGNRIKEKCETASKALYAGTLKLVGISDAEANRMVWKLFIFRDIYLTSYRLCNLLGIAGSDSDDALAAEVDTRAIWQTMLPVVIEEIHCGRVITYDGKCCKREGDKILRLIDFLEYSGLQLDYEETAFLCGTHELFTKKKKEDNNG